MTDSRVKLFWKLAVPDLGALSAIQLPADAARLPLVDEPRVTLLFFGGRDPKKAAQHQGIPLEEFRLINSRLSSLEGQACDISVESICIHAEVVFATVSLPEHIPFGGRQQPWLKLRVCPSTSGSIVLDVLQQPRTALEIIQLSSPILLKGTVAMETGAVLPGQRPPPVRPQRLADESQGQWVHVKKHSSMGCAVIRFPSSFCRDAVLQQSPAALRNKFRMHFDVKPHHEKTQEGKKVEVPEALFVGWKQTPGLITASCLQIFFDHLTAPLMTSCSRHEAHLADMLRNKSMGQHDTSSSGEDVVLLRLTRMARSPQVTHILLHSPVLEGCRRRIQLAGGDLTPTWANGAWIFVPGIQPSELQGMDLKDCHVIMYSSEVECLRKALGDMSCRDRPKLSHDQDMGRRKRPETVEVQVVCAWRTNSSFGGNSNYGY